MLEKFREDPLFQHFFAEAIPSQESFRQRLEQLGGKAWMSVVDAINAAFLHKANLRRNEMKNMSLIPLDIDISVL